MGYITLTDHEGFVCVTYTGFGYNEPVKQLTLFRTGVKTRDLEMNYAPLSEIEVTREHSYYRIIKRGLRYENSLQLFTVGEGNILINIPVPCPKVRAGIQTRWNGSGYWEKQLKSGWCRA